MTRVLSPASRRTPWRALREACLLAIAVLLLLPAAGYDFANAVQHHAGSAWGTRSSGPRTLAAFLAANPGVFTPARFRRAFRVPSDLTGRGQTIAFVEGENGFSHAALARFDRGFGLPPAHVSVLHAGRRAPARAPVAADETMLDVEWAHAIAPGARLVVIAWQVGALSTGEAQLAAALRRARPSVVSVSAVFAGPLALAAARLGWALGWSPLERYPAFVSTGDGGDGLGLPSILPSVAAVGGVAVRRGTLVPWPLSGHGTAAWVVRRPAWQAANRTPWRSVPDVAWLAGAPRLATYVGGWVAMEGTSAATPQWAALWALADQRRAEAGLPPLAAPAPAALYRIARERPDAFLQPVQPRAASTPGWSPVTGLGAPNVPAFLAAAAALPAGCCRAALPPLGQLPLTVPLFALACALYLVAARWPRRRSGWPAWLVWSVGWVALGAAAMLLAQAGRVYDAAAAGAYLVAFAAVRVRRLWAPA